MDIAYELMQGADMKKNDGPIQFVRPETDVLARYNREFSARIFRSVRELERRDVISRNKRDEMAEAPETAGDYMQRVIDLTDLGNRLGARHRPDIAVLKVTPPKSGEEPPAKDPLKESIRLELVEVIEDGKSLGPDAFRPPEYGPYIVWREKSREYVKTVFGQPEAQKLGEPYDASKNNLPHNIADRLRRLADLRDRPDTWELRVNSEGARKAAQARRFYSVPDQMVVAGSGLEQRVSPDSRESREEAFAKAPEVPAESPQPPTPIDPSASDFHGQKLLSISPEELFAFHSTHTSAQLEGVLKPYEGKPLRVAGQLANVSDVGGTILVLLNMTDGHQVAAMCANEWKPHLETLQKGADVELIGKLGKVGVMALYLSETEVVASP